MKRLFKPAAFLFYFLTILSFFFVGVYYAGLSGKAEDQGLAAGAIVIGYGVIFALVALVAALFFAFYKSDLLKRANRILFAVLVVFVLITTWRYMIRQGEIEREGVPRPLPPKTETTFIPASMAVDIETSSIGLGMFKPDFYNQSVLYFYSNPNLRKAVSEHLPVDSLVFERTELGVSLNYAPPWFDPAHLKLDYDVLWLRAESVGMGYVEVVVNEREGTTYYIDQLSGQLFYWPEFLLTVHSVELREDYPQSIRIKPLDHASEVPQAYFVLQPMMARGDWIKVALLNDDYHEVGTGWVRWRNDKEVVLDWSLLS